MSTVVVPGSQPGSGTLASPAHITLDLLDEPTLLFGGNYPHTNPKTGLADAGPADLASANHPAHIVLGLVGTGSTREKAAEWIDTCAGPIAGDSKKTRQVPDFPGFSAHSPFQSQFEVSDSPLGLITSTEVQNVISCRDYTQGFHQAMRLLTSKLQLLYEGVPAAHVILCALPNEIVEYCLAAGQSLRTESGSAKTDRLFSRLLKIESQTGQHVLAKLFDEEEPNRDFVGRNLRRALKAASGTMKSGKPIQIAREDSLFSGLSQHPAIKAWNFCTAMYYKAGALPWRLEGLDPETCFVGISFYRHLTEESFEMHTRFLDQRS